MQIQITWNEYGEALVSLAHAIKCQLDDYSSYTLVGLSRGGLIPLVYLSHHLDIKSENVFTLRAEHYSSENEPTADVIISQDPFWGNRIGNKILLVDDLLDSGATLKAVIEFLQNTYASQHIESADLLKIITAVVFTKQNIKRGQYCAHFGGKFMADEWLVFPYETP